MSIATEIDEIDTIPDDVDETEDSEVASPDAPEPRGAARMRRLRVGAYGALLALPFVLAIAVGGLKYIGSTESQTVKARTESVRAASDAAVAMLSYRPDTVQNDLNAAKDRMTGTFRDSYSSLVDDVVAPAAIQKAVTAVATVPAAASVSATSDHAVVLIFVNQSITVGKEAPASTNSCVRVTLDKVDNRWLISGFDPV